MLSTAHKDLSDDEEVQSMSVRAPAAAATLDMLGWNELCSHVAEFASTYAGKRYCKQLEVPEEEDESRRLVEETR